MNLTCPRCHAQHSVDPPSTARARSRPLRFRCSDCGHTFPVQTEPGAALPPALLPIEPPSRFASEPRSIAPGEPVEMLRVGGDVYHVPDMATLQRWILEGRAGREDSVSQHGMRWTPIGDRPDLALFFTAADRVVLSSPTIVPGPSPLSGDRAGLGMSAEEEIYVREEPEPNTSFIGDKPEADEVPPVADVVDAPFMPIDPTSEAIAAEEASSTSEVPIGEAHPTGLHVRSRTLEPAPGISTLSLHPVVDDATASADAAGPVDEVPPSLFVRREPELLADTLNSADFQRLRGDGRALGFELGPEPDTQEAELESTQSSNALADAFMATGQMDAPRVPNPAAYVPPPISFGGGKVPITVAPIAAPQTSILDDEPPPATSRPGPLFWLGLAAVAAFAVVGLGGAAWYAKSREEAGTPGVKLATASEQPVATLADAEARARAAVEGAKGVTVSGETPAPAENPEGTTGAPDPAQQEEAAADARKEAEMKAAQAKAAADQQVRQAAKASEEQARKIAAAEKAVADGRKAEAGEVAAPKATPAPKPSTKPAGTSPKALADAGWKAMDKGNVEEAHGYFSRALQADPSNGWATYGRGYANEKLGDKVSARSDYCSALARGSSDGELVAELNGSLRRLGTTCQ